MCVIRAIFLAALLAFLSAAQTNQATTDQGSMIDPNGGAQSEAGARIDDNGVK
jgi:hypothetical protein